MSLLVYGSYGYTGSLIAREATDRGLSVTLAGRNPDRLREQSKAVDRPFESVSLDETNRLEHVVADHDAVLHCAGPFSETAKPMVEACLAAGTDYLDITGEFGVLEAIADRDEAAEDAGVTLLPAVGFDVVPSDCLAAHLADRFPSANHLALAIAVEGGPSQGTAKTAIEHLDGGGVVRWGGDLVSVPPAWRTRRIDFGDDVGTKAAVTIPWGDVATAFHSTGIQNVEVYAAAPPRGIRFIRATRHLGPVLGASPVKRTLRWLVDKIVSGPDAHERKRGRATLWGEASLGDERVVSRLTTPETYAFTVDSATTVAERVLAGDVGPGFQTPSTALGADFVLDLEGVERVDVA
ncbi:MAG: short subunit dehydrogenase-like uncharacterized protein [Halobacteriales archaeon]|jgi:short subunit dehydrogenase-like uncharacterized protein